jgi:hypothetical protein
MFPAKLMYDSRVLTNHIYGIPFAPNHVFGAHGSPIIPIVDNSVVDTKKNQYYFHKSEYSPFRTSLFSIDSRAFREVDAMRLLKGKLTIRRSVRKAGIPILKYVLHQPKIFKF